MAHGRDRQRAALALAVALGVAVGGCQNAPAPIAAAVPAPSPSPLPSPSPSPTLPPQQPVVGSVETTTSDTSHNERLGLEEDGDPTPGSVEAATTAVAAGLDAWLDGAQAGAPDLDGLGASWLVSSDPAAAEVLRSGVTTPENPVAAATYRFDVHLEPDPTVVVADVDVRRVDGTSVRLDLLLDVTTPSPTLLVVEVDEAT